jgi:hypothetical protein
MRLVWVAAAMVALAITFACGSAGSPAHGTTITLGESDAGRTVQAKVGDTLRVTLQDDYPVPGSSLVWDVASLDPSVLQPGTVTRPPRVQSGTGAHDTYSADFRAIAAGQAVLDAHGTTSCEAMAKRNCPDRDFKITVVVTSWPFFGREKVDPLTVGRRGW